MCNAGGKLWVGLAVGVLGLAVGISDLVRGFGVVSGARDIVVGVVCVVLAAGWLVHVLGRLRRGGSV